MLQHYRDGISHIPVIDTVFPSAKATTDYLYGSGEQPRLSLRTTVFYFVEHTWGDATYMVPVADGIALTAPIFVPLSGRQDIPLQPEEIAACSASR